MNAEQTTCARACLSGSENNSMTFPEIVGKLIEAGFESYAVDFRRGMATYYLPSGESVEFSMHAEEAAVSARFDAARLQSAIVEAQTLAPGYTYEGFCRKAKAAGWAGYLVSFLGRRVVYFGRTGETHVEPFPQGD